MKKIEQLKKDKLTHEIKAQVQAFCTQKLWIKVYGNITDQDIKNLELEENNMDPNEKELEKVLTEDKSMISKYNYSPQDLQGEEDFIQWMSRLLLENQRQQKNQPIKYFKSKPEMDDQSDTFQDSETDRMLRVDSSARQKEHQQSGGIPFISSLTIKHLYELLNVRQNLNVEF